MRAPNPAAPSVASGSPLQPTNIVLGQWVAVFESRKLGLGGDGWGFRLLDRHWHEHISGQKPRGPRGKAHWSLACLCVDVPALTEAYAVHNRVSLIDYTSILRWVVTDDALGQSKLPKPSNYVEPLMKTSANLGRFVRLARLWEAAPEQAALDPFVAQDLARQILADHGASEEEQNNRSRSVASLILALKEVKQTRVTYLELAEYEEALGSRDTYNDAIVNIFTRLNTAGRTLTREDITFAWLKIGWRTEYTHGQSAKSCIEELADKLVDLSLPISVEDVVSAISFVWSVSFNAGKLLTNDDLMKGEAIRPMAANVSEHWSVVVEAVTKVSGHVRDRGWRFREHYQSVNSIAYLWAWYFAALRWRDGGGLKELEKDLLDKCLADALDTLVDRWLICSQWAGIWASAQDLTGYATRLATRLAELGVKSDPVDAAAILKDHLQSEVITLDQPATNGMLAINADDRQQVRLYYTSLWLWNRLDKERWKMAKLALRHMSRRQNSLEVDHIVAYDLWQSKVKSQASSAESRVGGDQ